MPSSNFSECNLFSALTLSLFFPAIDMHEFKMDGNSPSPVLARLGPGSSHTRPTFLLCPPESEIVPPVFPKLRMIWEEPTPPEFSLQRFNPRAILLLSSILTSYRDAIVCQTDRFAELPRAPLLSRRRGAARTTSFP